MHHTLFWFLLPCAVPIYNKQITKLMKDHCPFFINKGHLMHGLVLLRVFVLFPKTKDLILESFIHLL